MPGHDELDLDIEQLDTATEPGSPGWADFVATSALIDDVYAELEGDRGMTRTPEQRRIAWRERDIHEIRVWIARLRGEVVGFAFHRRPLHEGARESWLFLGVRPDARRQGVGSALLDRVVDEACHAGSTTLQSFVMSPLAGDEELLPVEGGDGGVPVGAPSTGLALARGFRLVQALVGSSVEVPLPADRLSALECALPASASDYDVLTWEMPTPPELVADVAALKTRMATDAPSGGTAAGPDPWDTDRLVEAEHGLTSMGRRRLYAAARHRASGRLVAFTEIDPPLVEGAPASQEFTLVLREHRGHGLGLLVKIANARHLAEASPGTTRITTYNADENAPMRRINEALGYRPSVVSGGWRLDL
ncbi:GNAT family N-acetyltransferase [Terrabacter sp. C0L_2]|uniref:GNAT family N-acetyltransferase n=1 Tax=Terrabacter sp. C0L_2 TaxID=3108389 RepID=UPI002ED2537D|nr:GNAT family N-acetyltransferase [Terrabacter sp. C0L_2]